MPLTVIVDHNGGVDVHVAVKSHEYDQVNVYVKIHAAPSVRPCHRGRANRWNTNQVCDSQDLRQAP